MTYLLCYYFVHVILSFIFVRGLFVLVLSLAVRFYVLCNFHSCNGVRVRMSHWIKGYLTWLDNETGCKVARLHDRPRLPVFTVWHRITGVKLQHLLDNALCHPEILPLPQIAYTCGHPAGHPKLLQLETPLIVRPTCSIWNALRDLPT